MLDFALKILSSEVGQALVIAALTALGAAFFRRRGKLIYGVGSNFMYLLPPHGEGPLTPVTSRQIWFENSGSQTIYGVEIILTYRPNHFEFWPPRAFTIETLVVDSANPRVVLRLAALNGQEAFQLHMLEPGSSGPPEITGVRWDGGVGKAVPMVISRRYPTWINSAMLALLIIGFAAIVYLTWQWGLQMADLYSRITMLPKNP